METIFFLDMTDETLVMETNTNKADLEEIRYAKLKDSFIRSKCKS